MLKNEATVEVVKTSVPLEPLETVFIFSLYEQLHFNSEEVGCF